MRLPFGAHTRSRIALLTLCAMSALQATWIVLAELHHPRTIQFPLDAQAALAARLEMDNAGRAASLAVARGDLWAESAFTYATLLWTDPAIGPAQQGGDLDQEARARLERAVEYSPHRGDAWLMLAAVADRDKWPTYRTAALLKMSYYTAPNELALMPQRLALAFRVQEEPELEDMVRQDIRMILTRGADSNSVLVAAYRNALPENRALVNRLVTEVDPAYAASMRTQSR